MIDRDANTLTTMKIWQVLVGFRCVSSRFVSNPLVSYGAGINFLLNSSFSGTEVERSDHKSPIETWSFPLSSSMTTWSSNSMNFATLPTRFCFASLQPLSFHAQRLGFQAVQIATIERKKYHMSLCLLSISLASADGKKRTLHVLDQSLLKENHPSPAAPSHLESLTMSSSSPASNGARDSPASGRAQSSSVSWHACADHYASSYLSTHQIDGCEHVVWSIFSYPAPTNQNIYDIVFYRKFLIVGEEELDKGGRFILAHVADDMGDLPSTDRDGTGKEGEETSWRSRLPRALRHALHTLQSFQRVG